MSTLCQLVLEVVFFSDSCPVFTNLGFCCPKTIIQQVEIEKKGKNKSREEIFYQMKGFFV